MRNSKPALVCHCLKPETSCLKIEQLLSSVICSLCCTRTGRTTDRVTPRGTRLSKHILADSFCLLHFRLTTVCLREAVERSESCHFGPLPGSLVRWELAPRGPQWERVEWDLVDSRLSHTRLNRRPIALSSLFCKTFQSQRNVSCYPLWMRTITFM